MTMQIIFCIAIVFLTVSSKSADADAGAKNNTICCKMVSRQVYRETSTRETYEGTYLWVFPWREYHTTINRTDYIVWKEECLPRNDSSTEICGCRYGWGGDSCNDSLFCTISQGIQINDSEVPKNEIPSSYLQRGQENAKSRSSDPISQERNNKKITSEDKKKKNRSLDPRTEWKSFPECNSKCLGEINSTDFNFTESGNMTYCFIPINSSCNAANASEFSSAQLWDFVKTYRYYFIGAATGIILLIIVICVTCVARKRRKIEKTENDIPMVQKDPADYMEENVIYL